MLRAYRLLFCSLMIIGLTPAASFASTQSGTPIVQSKAIQKVIKQLVSNHGFKKKELETVFRKVERQDKVIELMNRPAEALPWYRYRKIFVQETRISQGVEFWQKNLDTLARAEEKYGVPAEVIVAIIGVETRFGRNLGDFRVIDALATLVADYPKRRRFFSKELVHYMKLVRKEKIDPFSIYGSYAGALGKPQFMPSSFLAYAIDFDKDGKRDLSSSDADAIGSVANYLKKHGWNRNQPITGRATVSGDRYHRLIKKGLKPQVTLDQAHTYGVSLKDGLPSELKGALIKLEGDQGSEYWVGLKNFYAITRYNHSALYAMAVYQLGQAIRDSRGRLAVANS